MPTHLSRRAAGAIAIASAGLLLLAAPASAHVTITPQTAEPGGYATFTFKVPTERDDASTTQVQVAVPAGAKLAHVSVRPVPGWTVSVATTKLGTPLPADEPGEAPVTEVVSSITWKGGRIAPGEFQSFEVSMGPLPARTGSLAFKTLQTYSDGEVVRWIELPQRSQPHPEHPAPLLAISAAVQPIPAPAPAAQPGDDDTARWLGAGGLVAGLLGLAAGGFALRRRPLVTRAVPPAPRGAEGSRPAEPARR